MEMNNMKDCRLELAKLEYHVRLCLLGSGGGLGA